MTYDRKPTNYAVMRKQKRYIARLNMKKKGREKFCKHSYTGIQKGNFVIQTKVPSYFAEHWKEYVEVA